MRLVLDTNVYISAFLWGGKPKEILERAIEGIDQVFISRLLKDEIYEVLKRPSFKVEENVIEMLMSELEDFAELVVVTETIEKLCRDVNDNMVVECAVASKADYIITGDNDLLVLEKYRNIKNSKIADYLLEIDHE